MYRIAAAKIIEEFKFFPDRVDFMFPSMCRSYPDAGRVVQKEGLAQRQKSYKRIKYAKRTALCAYLCDLCTMWFRISN